MTTTTTITTTTTTATTTEWWKAAPEESADAKEQEPVLKRLPHPSGKPAIDDWQNEYREPDPGDEWKGWWERTPNSTAPTGSADLHARGVSSHRAVVGAASGGAEALVRLLQHTKLQQHPDLINTTLTTLATLVGLPLLVVLGRVEIC